MASSIQRSILLLATTLTAVGCQSGAVTKAMDPTSAGRGVAMLQAQAQAAVVQQVHYAGLATAEQRVAMSPDDLQARRTLAQVYFATGRFRSAAQAYDDALRMAPGDEALRLRKALALLAQGSAGSALAELEQVRSLPDAGLAYALAGQAERGIRILEVAARQSEATARTRQNLALAYALGGQWARARAVAAQDLDPLALEARVRQWAELAASGDIRTQTAGLLAITPASDDAGRPIGLAYVPPEARVVQAAAPTPAAWTVEVAAATPVVLSAAKPVPAASTAPSTPAAGGRWVVQLAAYDRAELLESNWKRLAARHSELIGDYAPVRSEVTIGARRYYRLGLSGFDARAEAIDLCESLQAKGRACFVRDTGAPAPRGVRTSQA